jgi:SpoVK/Ycf46/Vps4 family AAA+-type ATPase
MPTSYTPKTETERALQDSLKELEMQCKERVDLLEALRESRKEAAEAAKAGKEDGSHRKLEKGKSAETPPNGRSGGWLGEGTVPPVQYPDLSKPTPPLPPRQPLYTRQSSETVKERANSVPQLLPYSSPLSPAPTLAVPSKQNSRSPSPDANRKTMRTTLRNTDKRGFRALRTSAAQQPRRAEPMKAAGMAWDTKATPTTRSARQESDRTIQARLSATAARRSLDITPVTSRTESQPANDGRIPSPTDFISSSHWRDTSDRRAAAYEPSLLDEPLDSLHIHSDAPLPASGTDDLVGMETPMVPPPPPEAAGSLSPLASKTRRKSPTRLPRPSDISYRREYPNPAAGPAGAGHRPGTDLQRGPSPTGGAPSTPGITRKPVANSSTPSLRKSRPAKYRADTSSGSNDDGKMHKLEDAAVATKPRSSRKVRTNKAKEVTPPSSDAEPPEEDDENAAWEAKVEKLMKHLPKGVDEGAARQILNEIVVKGDEVHWDDVAGLDAAKKALKEAVVYPFLRPDLFMGLREPARGMLLFGPPGTGKTMLARAVATESKSTFFAISASSLTSKWHGESEKLVRALFALAKVLAPSIIFVDEIDSLLSARSGSSEHEASRRSKTEFLIQWSDLERAAAGRDTHAKGETGDPTRVLVLAATNMPWDIDEAARRRFVRRQYIPLPEAETRELQLRTLLGHQNHDLSERDISKMVDLTEGEQSLFSKKLRWQRLTYLPPLGFSGSDITALAKDAAMGPLRTLGEALLYTPMDQIKPITITDFEASLVNIRPSVSKQGLKGFEDWAREFGERGG